MSAAQEIRRKVRAAFAEALAKDGREVGGKSRGEATWRATLAGLAGVLDVFERETALAAVGMDSASKVEN